MQLPAGSVTVVMADDAAASAASAAIQVNEFLLLVIVFEKYVCNHAYSKFCFCKNEQHLVLFIIFRIGGQGPLPLPPPLWGSRLEVCVRSAGAQTLSRVSYCSQSPKSQMYVSQ